MSELRKDVAVVKFGSELVSDERGVREDHILDYTTPMD